MEIRPVGPQVLVRVVAREQTSHGGIVIPDNIDEENSVDWQKAMIGEVIGVGDGYAIEQPSENSVLFEDGRLRIPLDVQKGQRVLFPKNVGQEFDLDGAKHKLIHEAHVLGIIE